jgi:hypothetical protein
MDDLARAIGVLIINVSALEESLRDGIRLTLGQGEEIDVLAAGLPFRTLVEKFGALLFRLGTAKVPREEVQELCKHLDRFRGAERDISSAYVYAQSGEAAPLQAQREARHRIRHDVHGNGRRQGLPIGRADS